MCVRKAQFLALPASEARALSNLATVTAVMSRTAEAVDLYNRALAMLRQAGKLTVCCCAWRALKFCTIGSTEREARVLKNACVLYERCGMHSMARNNMQRALELCRLHRKSAA